jgi:RND family efflux transporter MFP subunit
LKLHFRFLGFIAMQELSHTKVRKAAFRGLAWGPVLGMLMSLAGSLGCSKGAPTASKQAVPRVTVADVVEQEVVDSDDYTGQSEASASVEVRARVFGFLKTIEFKDGDYVAEGQTLFTIEPDEYQAIHEQSLSRIELTTANYELAKSKLARDEKLRPTGAISQEEYEESIAAMRSAEATVTAAKADANRTALDVKYTEIKAPMSGRIDRALVSKGNLLTGGMTNGTLLTTIVAEQPMYVYFDVDERSLLGYLRRRPGADVAEKPGSLRELAIPCYVQLADESDFPHEGKIDFASAEVNKSTGTARLRGVFENKDRSLVSGLFVRIRIPVSKPYQALLIPERALATDQNIRFVYVVGDDGKAARRNVELGGQRGDLRIVKAGLTAGDRVIVKGLQRVRPGQQVEAEAESTAVAGIP